MTRTDIDNYQRSSVERTMPMTAYARSEIARLDKENADLQSTIDRNNELRREIINRANMNKGAAA
ncbi:hypothetical protein E0D81_21035 [Lelliottia amnigena]|uniref:hypothetical protein n=1 Tax=Lelliottia amnigena TaxID=61646 RepID=UPI001039C2A7|nr:hypothetical protein [Lelliottia amnigena]TCD13593.1 hypothetical protein E0D81_21035 [Lelliottia amnigena]